MKRIDNSIDVAADQATRFKTLAAKEYAKTVKIDRTALSHGVRRQREIKAFLEELFKKKKEEEVK